MRRRARIEAIFGGEQPSGWFPLEASVPLPTPEEVVTLDITIEGTGDGYILEWEGPSFEYSGDNWYPDLPAAEEAALELFGLTATDWAEAD